MKVLDFYFKHASRNDFICSFLVSLLLTIWTIKFGGATVLTSLLDGNRAQVFGTVAGIFGAMLGFLITATSIIIGFASDSRLQLMQESTSYPELFKTFTSTIWVLAIATLISVIGLVLDRDSNPAKGYIIAESFFVTLSLLRVTWCILILENLINFLVSRRSPLSQK